MNTTAFVLASPGRNAGAGRGLCRRAQADAGQGRMAGLASVTGVGRWASGSTFIGLGSERRPPDHR